MFLFVIVTLSINYGAGINTDTKRGVSLILYRCAFI